MNKDLIKLLKDVAKQERWIDDENFNPCDFSGGNYDDAYWGGNGDGKIGLAREILEKLNA
jgi:hypothetical protein